MIALSTGSLHSYGLARVFELAAQVGFDGIEVIVDHRHDSRDPAYLHRLSAACGLPPGRVICPGVFFALHLLPSQWCTEFRGSRGRSAKEQWGSRQTNETGSV